MMRSDELIINHSKYIIGSGSKQPPVLYNKRKIPNKEEYCRKGHWKKHLHRQGIKMANFVFILFLNILMIYKSLLRTA